MLQLKLKLFYNVFLVDNDCMEFVGTPLCRNVPKVTKFDQQAPKATKVQLRLN